VASSSKRMALSAPADQHLRNRFGALMANKGLGAPSGEVSQVLGLNLVSRGRGSAKRSWWETLCCRGQWPHLLT